MRREPDPKIVFTKQLLGLLRKAGVSYYRDGDFVVRFSLDKTKEVGSISEVTLEASNPDREQPSPDVESEKIDFEFSHVG